MDQLTLEQAAIEYDSTKDDCTINHFKAGAEWQKEQLLTTLKTIAQWPGNLSDEHYITKTGANDAALRGNILVIMRAIAKEAVQKFEPNYHPY